MRELFAAVSKYGLTFVMAVYTYLSFRYFGVKEEKREGICRKQLRLLLLFHGWSNGVLFVGAPEVSLRMEILLFYGVQLLFFVCYPVLMRRCYPQLSRSLFHNMCMLLAIGFLMLARLNMEMALRQFAIVLLGAAVTWPVPWFMKRVWQISRIPWVFGLLGILGLLLVLLTGSKSFGAKLSLAVGGISFQPSEFIKLTFVFFAAGMFYRSTQWKQVVAVTAAAAAHVVLLVLSKDLGGALLFFITYLFLLYAATSRKLYLAAAAAAGGLGAALAYHLFSHVRSRVEVWRNPWADIDDKGYHITQSLFAIGTGGWFGMGLYQGMPKRIPVVEKDFIFAAISEEMGALFALCLLLLCLGCFLQFVMTACRMQALFYKLIAFGLGVMYISQVFLTVGGVTKFIPLTGVTLPLVSYGGSSMLSTMLSFAVLQGLYILKREEEEEAEG